MRRIYDLAEFKHCELLSLDFETYSLVDYRPMCFSLSGYFGNTVKDSEIIYGIFNCMGSEDNLNFLMKEILPGKRVTFHNFKFDGKVLVFNGFDLNLFRYEDTILMARLLYDEHGMGLKDLIKTIFNHDMVKFDLELAEAYFRGERVAEFEKYSGEDAIYALMLFSYLRGRIIEEDLVTAYMIELKVVVPVMMMELNGIQFDPDKCDELKVMTLARIKDIEDYIYDKAGRIVYMSSNNDLSVFIFDELGVPYDPKYSEGMKTKTRSIRSAVLEELLIKLQGDPREEAIEKIVEWKKLNKLLTSFFDGQKKAAKIYTDGRIRSSFNQVSVVTGRYASTEPNLQQLPTAFLVKGDSNTSIRSMYVAKEGYKLIDVDFSQIELRLLAHFCNDKAMVEGFWNGEDYHQKTVDMTHGIISRREAKIANFGMLYGMNAYGFAMQARIPVNDAYSYYRNYDKAFPGVPIFKEQVKRFVINNKYIRFIGGRKRRMYEEMDEKGIERIFVNALIQGCLDGEMRVRIKGEGYKKLKDLEGRKVTIWDGEKFVSAFVVNSGKKQLAEVEFHGGKVIRCSPDHKYSIINTRGNKLWKKVSELVGLKNQHVEASGFCGDEFKSSVCVSGKHRGSRFSDKPVHNINNFSIEDIKDDFKRGVFVGRVVSDGSITDGKAVLLLVAEHEKEIEYIIEDLISHFKFKRDVIQRDGKQNIVRYLISSAILARQLISLGVKDRIPEEFFANKELLRGFLVGMFDGDGTVTEKGNISLCFGKGSYYEEYSRDIQRALNVFGVRGRLSFCTGRINVNIQMRDSIKFKDEVGFLKKSKVLRNSFSGKLKDWIKGKNYIIKNIKITDEYIQMFDVVNSESGKFMVEDVIVHNSAAVLLKMAMIKLYEEFKNEECKMVCMIHDEILFEVPEEKVDYYSEHIKTIMEFCIKLRVPIIAEPQVINHFGEVAK